MHEDAEEEVCELEAIAQYFVDRCHQETHYRRANIQAGDKHQIATVPPSLEDILDVLLYV